MKVTDLPTECLVEVFAHLQSVDAIIHCTKTCQKFRNIIFHLDGPIFRRWPQTTLVSQASCDDERVPYPTEIGAWFESILHYKLVGEYYRQERPTAVEHLKYLDFDLAPLAECDLLKPATDKLRILNLDSNNEKSSDWRYILIQELEAILVLDLNNRQYEIRDEAQFSLKTKHLPDGVISVKCQIKPDAGPYFFTFRQSPKDASARVCNELTPDGRMRFFAMGHDRSLVSLGSSSPRTPDMSATPIEAEDMDYIWDVLPGPAFPTKFNANLSINIDIDHDMIHVYDQSPAAFTLPDSERILTSRKLNLSSFFKATENFVLSETHLHFMDYASNTHFAVELLQVINSPMDEPLQWTRVCSMPKPLSRGSFWKLADQGSRIHFACMTNHDTNGLSQLAVAKLHSNEGPVVYTQLDSSALWIVDKHGTVAHLSHHFIEWLVNKYRSENYEGMVDIPQSGTVDKVFKQAQARLEVSRSATPVLN